jgi:hypothetical protein
VRIFHLTYTSVGGLPFFTSEAAYREAVHRLAKLKHAIALFCLVAEHLHQVAVTNGEPGSAVSKATKRALGSVVETPFGEDTDIRTVEDRHYVANLLRYDLVQPLKHRQGHPALWEGSCFQDLIGARRVRGMRLCIEMIIPTFNVLDACGHVNLPRNEIQPASAEQLLAAGLPRLVSAAATAFAAKPTLEGNGFPEVEARCAVAKLGRWIGLHDTEITPVIGVTERGLRNLRRRSMEREALDAVRMRIALEDAVLATTKSTKR